jgi:Protein of unknown function (DUF2924)
VSPSEPKGHKRLLSGPRIKPGTQLLRVWRDQTHRVTVLPDGFEAQSPGSEFAD